MLMTLLLNLTLLVALAFVSSLSIHDWPEPRTRRVLTARALVAGACAVLLLALPTDVPGGVQIDTNQVPIALVAMAYGAPWGALAALPVLLARAALLPGTLPVAALSAALVLLVAHAARRWRLRERLPSSAALLLVPLLLFSVDGLSLLLLPDGLHLLARTYLPLLLLNTVGYAATVAVIAERVKVLKVRSRWQAEAHTDALTGLNNRRLFTAHLEALRPGDHLILVDADHFKRVNDVFGHDVGDEVLQGIAQALITSAPPGTRAYRLGGEEFALIVPGRSGAQALKVAQACWAAARTPRVQAGQTLRVTCSVGVADVLPGEAPAATYKRADAALYAAKTAGRDQVVVARAGRHHSVTPEASARTTMIVVPSAPASTQLLWGAVRATLDLMTRDRDLTPDDWGQLLYAAVMSVPGAEAGTLAVREGDMFRIVAQFGTPGEQVGLRYTEHGKIVWHGHEANYRSGRPRVLDRAGVLEAVGRIDASSRERGVAFPEPLRTRLLGVRSSLMLPVTLDGEVTAQFNLESYSSDDAFEEQAVQVALDFGRQASALLGVHRDRARDRERRQELEAIARVTQALRRAVSEPEMHQILAREMLHVMHTEHVAFLAPDGPDLLRSTAILGGYAAHGPVVVPRGRGLAWAALAAGDVLLSPDVQQDARVERASFMGADTLIAAPLTDALGEPLGVLVAARHVGRPFRPLDLTLARAVASAGETAIERTRHLTALRGAHWRTMEVLGELAEARGDEPAGHTARVSRLAGAFAGALHADDGLTQALRYGAALHDLGVLCLPVEARGETRVHPVRGEQVARQLPGVPPLALQVIRHHHERWDGRGTPEGLRGEAIPLAARAFSIVNAYEALTGAGQHTPSQALAALRAQAGAAFDPRLVELFAGVVVPATSAV
ncbi:diguanylate cyclase domain-containing protein [Deinococcus maricopensis]|uniref:Diguanylate cyclase and metal dependent phosphohydrolase n=1 Tax=Deinococcus maricopensis (strain DSM 21211 / LMG 22137 / NRRL B-23946 / LB-34) TaxID=709986 RepID=E8UAX0_DEIML|nr:diguanylate cyclase [Deinococcus maricopensis]ADV68209.1 diguanylate cyclase and metal dependent phosphohydrolase [Deinococcus maricopensis DSM 21211]